MRRWLSTGLSPGAANTVSTMATGNPGEGCGVEAPTVPRAP